MLKQSVFVALDGEAWCNKINTFSPQCNGSSCQNSLSAHGSKGCINLTLQRPGIMAVLCGMHKVVVFFSPISIFTSLEKHRCHAYL